MRLNEIIEHPIDIIKNNCKQYIKENPDYINYPLYRGMSWNFENFQVLDYPKKRKSMNMPLVIQDELDYSFNKYGFKALRSNSIYCTGSGQMADGYGKTHVIFPIGNFSYTWSPNIDDLYLELNEIKRHLKFEDPLSILKLDSRILEDMKKFNPDIKSIEDYEMLDFNKLHNLLWMIIGQRSREFINSVEFKRGSLDNFIMKNFKSTNLTDAIFSNNEILITGDKYLAIERDYYEDELVQELEFA